jgi:BACON domain-containing protein
MRQTFEILLTGVLCALLGACGGGGNGGAPVLSLSQTNLSFTGSLGIANDPAPQMVNVTNTGSGTLNFAASSDSPWLTVAPGAGSSPRTVTLTALLGTLTAGTYTGHVMVSATGAQGSPATITVTFMVNPAPSNAAFWAQWGANPQHAGMVNVAGQSLTHQLADIVYDPFVAQEQAESLPVFGGADLVAHFQATITDGNDVYMMMKTGHYTPCNPAGDWANGTACGPNAWQSMVWNETRFSWENGQLVKIWSFVSDWKPEPNATNSNQGFGGLGGWEPVFHAVDANNFIYVPGAGGSVWKVEKVGGTSSAHIMPPLGGLNTNTATAFVSGPLTADSTGNIYYNVIALANQGSPWDVEDVAGAWLVKLAPNDTATTVTYATLIPGAPLGTAVTCPGRFRPNPDPLPWPPASVIGTNQGPPPTVCGSQRPGVNIAPAVAADGTVYTVSRAHFNGSQAYLVAVNPDLTPKWQASLRNLLNDGCGFLVPISGPANMDPNSCRNGATPGIDPTTNAPGSGKVTDQGSSSPTVVPDGVVFGALVSYNYARGELLKFDAQGNFQSAYPFGWDSTPGVYTHNGTYSLLIKDNHYGAAAYCGVNSPICAATPQLYFITQVNPNMQIEWQFQSTNTMSCQRNLNGPPTCVSDHPFGFEWCINMPAIDANGTVYVNSEDGNIYELPQPTVIPPNKIITQPGGNLFLNLAIGAAYTPLSIGSDGKLYTQNDGHLFVVGN